MNNQKRSSKLNNLNITQQLTTHSTVNEPKYAKTLNASTRSRTVDINYALSVSGFDSIQRNHTRNRTTQ